MDYDYLKGLFHKVCVNAFVTHDIRGGCIPKGTRMNYFREDLDTLCEKAIAEGRDEFYANHSDPNDSNSPFVEADPRYEYVLNAHLTEKEYTFLMTAIDTENRRRNLITTIEGE